MEPNTPEWYKFRENVFILHACIGIAALKAIELETEDTELQELRKQVVAYYNKFNGGINKEYLEAVEETQERLQKEVERFAKKNIK